MIVMPWHRPPRDHSNERPDSRPTPVVRLDPSVILPDLPEPDLEGTIPADQELADAHRYSPDEAYKLAARMWGHEFGVSWAAYVAGLTPGRCEWTMRQIHELLFLRYLHGQGRA